MSAVQSDTSPAGRFVPANGLAVYCEAYGGGEPVLFLHGFLSTGRVWQPYVPLLSPDFTLHLPDLRGHGQTENPGGAISTRLLAGDVAALIAALGLERPCLCGWSMGGDVALRVARRYPDLVGKLIVGGVTLSPSDTYFASLKAMGLDGPGQVNFERAEQAIPQLVAVWQAQHRQSPTHWKELATQLSHDMLNPELPTDDDLRQIAAPALIVWGDRDQFLPIDDAVALYRALPQARLAVVPNADPFVTRTHPEHFARLVRDFLLSG